MTFKKDWEKKKQQIGLPREIIDAMVKLAFPSKKFLSFETLSEGCTNLNYCIHLESERFPYILRIYLRDHDAAHREQKLAMLLKSTIPIPLIYFIGNYDQYHFAITEHLPGITLRELLLSHKPHDLNSLMFNAGSLLTEIQAHTFQTAGFFNKELVPVQPMSDTGYIEFGRSCLKHPIVTQILDVKIIAKIKSSFEQLLHFFPAEHEKQLVHGDYDPANILVAQKNHHWQITGVLDWEFSFSSSPLWDVANMLRYAHQMPPAFEQAFLLGLRRGFALPENWHITIHLLNLLSLLDCLARSSIKNSNQVKDIRTLINYIIKQIEI